MNTLAYLASSSATKEKSFKTLTPGFEEPVPGPRGDERDEEQENDDNLGVEKAGDEGPVKTHPDYLC
jgi:hypothetical protein